MLRTKILQKKRCARSRFQLKKAIKCKFRLAVFRSGKNMYAQIIDDVKGYTLVSASTLENEISKDLKKCSDINAANLVGKVIAKRAKQSNIEVVVFDRGGYKYHGRVKALAESARANGLKF